MVTESTEVSRRAVLSVAGGTAITGLALPADSATGGPGPGPPDPAADAAAALRPVSMALHLHGPFSEGVASYEAHLQQARKHGVNVVWWTDHDFRIAARGHRRAVRFNGRTEPEDGLGWTWKSSTEGALTASTAAFVSAPRSPDEPGTALRLTATGAARAVPADGAGEPDRAGTSAIGTAGGGTFWYTGSAWNETYSTCLADTTLSLDVYPQRVGANAALLVRLELSYHPARAGRPAGRYVLQYRVGAAPTRKYTTAGLVGTVHLRAPSGQWTRLSLRLVEDVAQLWPDLVAGDNSLHTLKIGVAAGPGATATVVVDRLRFQRARRQGQAGEQLRAEVLARYRTAYPDVVQHRAYEISLVRHLNWFGGDLTLPYLPSPPKRNDDPALTASMVDFLHAHGGIVCWNHPMDVEKRESLARLMIKTRALGVDLVEIGRTPQDDLLWVFDVAARNALFFTAVGATDDHDGKDWIRQEENLLTYAWAASTGQAELVRALRRGRAWFADPARYRGALDLRIRGVTAMGSVAVTSATTVAVDVIATGLPAGSTLEIITGVADRAGAAALAPATTVQRVPAAAVTGGRYPVRVRPQTGRYVRTQVRTRDGAFAAVSNPLWLLRTKPPHGVPADRRLTLP